MYYLLDSNVIIDLAGKKLPQQSIIKLNSSIKSGAFNSVITRIEVLGYNGLPEEMSNCKSLLDSLLEIELTNEVVEATINLKRLYPKIKLPDVIIVATALEYNLTLITHNKTDFKNIDGLSIIDSYDL